MAPSESNSRSEAVTAVFDVRLSKKVTFVVIEMTVTSVWITTLKTVGPVSKILQRLN